MLGARQGRRHLERHMDTNHSDAAVARDEEELIDLGDKTITNNYTNSGTSLLRLGGAVLAGCGILVPAVCAALWLMQTPKPAPADSTPPPIVRPEPEPKPVVDKDTDTVLLLVDEEGNLL